MAISKERKVYKYLIAYDWENMGKNGVGVIQFETVSKLRTFKRLNEIIELIKKQTEFSQVILTTINYLGKGKEELA